MAFIYSGRSVASGSGIREIDASRKYAEHNCNLITLRDLYKTLTNRNDRIQCNNEMMIAQRKMKHWYARQNFDLQKMIQFRTEILKGRQVRSGE
jgi:CRISPR/Cas system CSM-associated protein Csm2 small subunit